jgi:hypothetical protein
VKDVEVHLMTAPDGRTYLRVKLRCDTRPELAHWGTITPEQLNDNGSLDKLAHLMGTLCGAMCERQISEYGSRRDPAEAYRLAGEVTRQLFTELAQTKPRIIH